VDPASWDKAKDVIFEALERAAEDREAFVRQRCPDPATCAEILSLLSSAATRDDLAAGQPAGERSLERPTGPWVTRMRWTRGAKSGRT